MSEGACNVRSNLLGTIVLVQVDALPLRIQLREVAKRADFARVVRGDGGALEALAQDLGAEALALGVEDVVEDFALDLGRQSVSLAIANFASGMDCRKRAEVCDGGTVAWEDWRGRSGGLGARGRDGPSSGRQCASGRPTWLLGRWWELGLLRRLERVSSERTSRRAEVALVWNRHGSRSLAGRRAALQIPGRNFCFCLHHHSSFCLPTTPSLFMQVSELATLFFYIFDFLLSEPRNSSRPDCPI